MDQTHWSEEIEEICEKLRINCVNLSEYHRKRYYTFKSYGKWFRLPLIVLASVNSTASVGLQPVLDQQIISGITCLLGMIMGIIGSLELYLGIQSSMELELKQSKEYYTLAIHLFKTLTLKRENRLEDGKEYLNSQYSLYIKLCESSNLLDRKMKTDLLAAIPTNYESNSSQGDETEYPKLFDLTPRGSNSNILEHYNNFHKNSPGGNLKIDIFAAENAIIDKAINETESQRKDTESQRKDTESQRKETESQRKDTESQMKETDPSNNETDKLVQLEENITKKINDSIVC